MVSAQKVKIWRCAMPIETKKVIADKYLQLLQKKNIDKITVKELIDACGISRPAFYYHFQDILDLSEWIAEKKISEAVSRSLEKEDPVDAIESFFRFAGEFQSLIAKISTSQRSRRFAEILIETVRGYLVSLLRHRWPELPISQHDHEVTLLFIAYGISGMMLMRNTNESLDAHKLAEITFQMLSEQLKLERFEK